jgi:hypothetical protein
MSLDGEELLADEVVGLEGCVVDNDDMCYVERLKKEPKSVLRFARQASCRMLTHLGKYYFCGEEKGSTRGKELGRDCG